MDRSQQHLRRTRTSRLLARTADRGRPGRVQGGGDAGRADGRGPRRRHATLGRGPPGLPPHHRQ
eukprot:2007024-Heterocapsa_arctica.AAC.1